MQILSHRGYWKNPSEKNAAVAFLRSFQSGFGTETDFREIGGILCLAHDLPTKRSMKADDFFALHRSFDPKLPLALNVKADGLQPLMKKFLDAYNVKNSFVFDMSVPDALGYVKVGIPAFTRQSEYEREPAFYKEAAGVWMDCFHGDWAKEKDVGTHLKAKKQVGLVSPELHGRDPLPMWSRIAKFPFVDEAKLMLCTDRPEDARRFFDG